MLFLKAMLIGLCIAAPVGPIGMLCIQRSLSLGFRSGMATGLGAASADAFYGLLGALGCAGLVTAFPKGALTLQIAGGCFLVYLALTILRGQSASQTSQADASPTRRYFLSTFLLTLSNPLTILSFVAIFAAVGAAPIKTVRFGYFIPMVMVTGVFLGSFLWWLCLSGFTSALRTRVSVSMTRGIAKVSSLAISAIGIVQIVSGGYRLIAGS
ncbi:Threonine/homoserine/homoserine lactone efflux protein [Burkholderia sp. D7]|nr:Threonine/homoserine/homoserine lactone efflux protein [Burkholderia sp. D7]